MGPAPHHALAHQADAQWTRALNLQAHRFGNGAGAVWPTPELSHRMQIGLFTRSEAIKSHPEEIALERIACHLAGLVNIVQVDVRAFGLVPGVFAPFLQEVGIPPGDPHDLRQRLRGDFTTFLPDRIRNRLNGRLLLEGANA
jgi:hypothetical protein